MKLKVTTCLLLLFSSLLAFHNWFGLGDRVIFFLSHIIS